ncbi:MAG: RrF2 family transcriptional regulator [Ilumatobacteraceae bacterium]
MRISHRVDYAVRAVTSVARHNAEHPGEALTGHVLAAADDIPETFLDDILRSLRNSGIVRSQRGPGGGWLLARPASDITVADIIRAVEGPLASVRGIRPHELAEGSTKDPFVATWIAVRHALRGVLEAVTVQHLATGKLPGVVTRAIANPDAWDARDAD